MELIDGKKISDAVKLEIAQEVDTIKKSGGKIPHLCAILVGHDGASETYVGHKEKACAQVGFKSTVLRYENGISEAELLKQIANINNDSDIDGLIVQLPLPAQINEQKVIEAIDPRKDVDGFHPINVGRMEDIPDEFIARQLNDSRYISKVVKGLLSNIVRVDDEQEVTSKNVISTSGAVTSILKKDWGLNDAWNEIISPRFERLNQLTNSTNFGHMEFEVGHLYHIYNQGNNRRKVFFVRDNYLFFLNKMKHHLLPYADILAWCLMPNHFHIMAHVAAMSPWASFF